MTHKGRSGLNPRRGNAEQKEWKCVLLPAPTSQVTLVLGVKQENRGEVISARGRGAQETQESRRTCYLKFLCQSFILQIKVP